MTTECEEQVADRLIESVERHGEISEAEKLLNIAAKCAESASRLICKSDVAGKLRKIEISRLIRLASRSACDCKRSAELLSKANSIGNK